MMKTKNKVQVYPSSSSSSSPSPSPAASPAGEFLSVLNLLPAAIISLTLVLSIEERQVLAYMMTRSMKSTNPSSSFLESKKKTLNTHKPPLFECDCFDCYTSYWVKWDSSTNRELIHQAIEAFEESLSTGEQSHKKTKKKRDKMGHRRLVGKTYSPPPEIQELPEYDVAPVEEKAEDKVLDAEVVEPEAAAVVVLRGAPASHQRHRGLARKLLPDVIGLFNWRLWSLWNPNV